MSRKYAGKDWRYMLHQEKAAASARAARASQPGEAVQAGQVPYASTDKARITLAGLRFMGQEPHPSQTIVHEPEPWGCCIWCGCDSGIDRPFTCSAPDGNGHLFEEIKR